MALKKQGLVFRINGENIGRYPDFMDTLPKEMVQTIEKAPVCKNLTTKNCSWKDCRGYDFMIGNEHFQKCYMGGCFEFPVTKESESYIKSFVKNETEARKAV